jgi:alanine-synthesizing transaminase
MSHMEFADRLRKAMDDADLKQVDLVRIAADGGQKLGKSQLSQYLSGKTMPRQATLQFLAVTLNVSPDWLAGTAEEGAAAESDSPADQAEAAAEIAAAAEAVADAAVEAAAQLAATPDNDQSPAAPNPPVPQKGTPMREFKKSSKLDNVLYDVRGPVVDEANRMEEAGTHVLKLNIGNPRRSASARPTRSSTT